eukprot:6470298-Amphidinium_carterae.1
MRVAGLAAAELTRKRPLKQMTTLSVDMIAALESTVWEAEALPDAVIAGHLLFLPYARARWSDVQAVVSLEMD